MKLKLLCELCSPLNCNKWIDNFAFYTKVAHLTQYNPLFSKRFTQGFTCNKSQVWMDPNKWACIQWQLWRAPSLSNFFNFHLVFSKKLLPNKNVFQWDAYRPLVTVRLGGGVSVQGDLCLGGLCLRGYLSSGGGALSGESLSQGVSVRGVSVQGGLCLGGFPDRDPPCEQNQRHM